MALEPSEGVALDADRAGGEEDDPEVGLEQVEELGDLLDQRVLAGRLEEGIPVSVGTLEQVLAPEASERTPSMSKTTAGPGSTGPSRQRQWSGVRAVTPPWELPRPDA